MKPALEVVGLSRAFGGIIVAADIDLTLMAGDRIALIGPNGAGKTTFVNLVTGALKPSSGLIRMEGEEITTTGPVDRVRRGLVRTFQITRLFPGVTVAEHVALAVLVRKGLTSSIFRDFWSSEWNLHEVQDILLALGIDRFADSHVETIAYGQQRLVEIAIAMALQPKVLLLDEPAAGASLAESDRIISVLDNLPINLAVMMIEHDMDLVFRFAKRIVVLAAGKIIADGTPQAIALDPNVRSAYLGSYATKGAFNNA